ncbi:hypothetical protein LJK88_07540 [Paenibacillus sp. P26]|nr:hypothetical protein LJK88_07540 [Paenibacillus sp. P26]UUZ90198.1 hypothetical protein LJK87_30035 [Paenibacillus sp. P25]
MCLVFVEYAIKPECRDEYLVWMERVRRLHPETEWYESEVQPGLFVELWRGQDAEGFERMKWSRTGSIALPKACRIRIRSTGARWTIGFPEGAPKSACGRSER